jgi:hypothetical protein
MNNNSIGGFMNKTLCYLTAGLLVLFFFTGQKESFAKGTPAEILADQYLWAAREAYCEQEYAQALEKLEAIKKKNLPLPTEFYYFYGKYTLKGGGEIRQAKECLNNYIVNIKSGRGGIYYTEALELLEECDNPNTIDQFTACGKTWKVGPDGCSWYSAQKWISGLGGGWRMPTKEELRELYLAVKDKSPIRDKWPYATDKDGKPGWHMYFGTGFGTAGEALWVNYLTGFSEGSLAVAVLSH